MGVSGFFKFVDSDPQLRPRKVDLAKEAMTSDRAPILVVDLPNLVRGVWGDLDFFCGGQHREFRRKMAAFVDKLRKAGIKPVFVTDGATPEVKLENWVGRLGDRWKFVEKMYDSAQSSNSSKRIRNERTARLLPHLRAEQMIRSLDCELLVAVEDCDLLAAETAAARNAFGLLAHDSDYFFFPAMEGVKLYSNTGQKLFGESCGLTTTAYDSTRLAARLSLSMHRMPLLASLLNTDYISSGQLRGLQSMVGGGDGSDKSTLVYNLAAWIKRTESQVVKKGFHVNYDQDYCKAEFDKEALIIRSLLQTILNRSDEELSSKIMTSVCTYYSTDNDYEESKSCLTEVEGQDWKDTVKVLKESYTKGEGSLLFPVALGLLDNTLGVTLEDFNGRTGLPPVYLVSLPLRKIIYGLLLKDKPGATDRSGIFNMEIREWVSYGRQTFHSMKKMMQPQVMKPSLPSGMKDYRSLLLNLHKNNDKETNQLRFKLLAQALSDCGDAGFAATSKVLQDLDPRDLSIFVSLAVMLGYRGHINESCYLSSSFDALNCDCRRNIRVVYNLRKKAYKPIMEMWEARAFVAAHFGLTRRVDKEERCRVGNGERYNPRAAHLAMIFLAVPICDLDWVIGRLYKSRNKFAVARRNLSFDGIKFQRIYKDFEKDKDTAWKKHINGFHRNTVAEANNLIEQLQKIMFSPSG